MTRDNYRDIELAQLRRLEFASLVEGTTLLFLLVIAVPLKHLYGWPTGVRFMGPVHGLAFCAYLWFTVQTVTGGGWRMREIARVVICAFIPFGAFFNRTLLSRKMASIRNGKKS
jgi:integral membrane protein